MPFLPLLLLLQVFGRTTSFALGWATSLFFGQIPGDKGYAVSMAIVLSFAWFLGLVLVGPIVVFAIGADALGWWDLRVAAVVSPLEVGILAAGLVLLPPLVTLTGELSRFHKSVSLRRWATHLHESYAVALSLGSGLLLMLVVTPFVLLRHWREGRRTLHIPIVVKDGHFANLAEDLRAWVAELTGQKASSTRLSGARAWPMTTLRFAAARLLRSVVVDDPVCLQSGAVEVGLFATDLSVTAPRDDAHRLRAALHKRLALTEAYLTWSEVPQRLEARLMELHRTPDLSLEKRIQALERLQEEIDAATIPSEEWHVLYRLRLQVERDAYEAARGILRARAG